MSEQDIIDLLRACIASGVRIGAPMMLAALAMGVVIGLAQALTSIQEMTLTFVPKVGAMIFVFWVSMTFMSGALVNYLTASIIPLVAGL